MTFGSALLLCDPNARTTVGNAAGVAAHARELGATEVVLVTSAWHAPRARVLVRAALGRAGVRVRTATAPGARPPASWLARRSASRRCPCRSCAPARAGPAPPCDPGDGLLGARARTTRVPTRDLAPAVPVQRSAPDAVRLDGIFLGGWSVAAHVYEPGLPAGWSSPEQPGFRETGGRFAAYVEWAAGLVRARGVPTHLAGHSLGGAVAIAVAAREPGLVPRVTCFAPAGLPAQHGLRHAARDVVANGLGLRLGASTASRSAIRALDHPRAALRLAREVERLDLTRELDLLRLAGVELLVVAAAGDRVATPDLCRRLAALGGGRCVVDDGARDHLWVLTSPERLLPFLAP